MDIQRSAYNTPSTCSQRTRTEVSDQHPRPWWERGLVSTSSNASKIPWAPLDAPTFGLVQENFVDEPFWSIIATRIFLVDVKASTSLPVFWAIKALHPTPKALQSALNSQKQNEHIKNMMRPQGLVEIRIATLKRIVGFLLQGSIMLDRRIKVKDYPCKGDGRGRPHELGDELTEADGAGVAWETGEILANSHYCHDSWRIFHRDVLRSKFTKAVDYDGGGTARGFEPEWMRVLLKDAELRAFLRWKWLQRGYLWDAETGDKKVAGVELMGAAIEGRIRWSHEDGSMVRIGIDDPSVQDGSFKPIETRDPMPFLKVWATLTGQIAYTSTTVIFLAET